jgi:hypothetical protein
MKIREINRMIDNNIIPNAFNFTLQEKETIDWDKLTYNDYNSFDNCSKKFTKGWETIPGFDLIIQEIADNITSPLEEMNERLRISELDSQYKKSIELANEKAIETTEEWLPLEMFDNIFKKNI